MECKDCPFSSCLLDMARCAAESHTTCSKVLAKKLGLTAKTVDTYWHRIHVALNAEDRYRAMEIVRESGWLELPASPRGGGGKVENLLLSEDFLTNC